MAIDVLESRTQAIGRELFSRVAGAGPSFLALDRFTGTLVDHALALDRARLQLFRFVDVLPALADDAEIARHLREYFEGRPVPFAGLMRVALGIARAGWPGEKAPGAALRFTVRQLARRFIAGTTPAEVIRAAAAARSRGRTFTIDVLGEACLGEDEAAQYQRRYLELIERVGAEARRWSRRAALDEAPWGGCRARTSP